MNEKMNTKNAVHVTECNCSPKKVPLDFQKDDACQIPE